MSGELKTCTKCGTAFPATTEHFSPHKQSPGGLRAWCRPCHREDARQYRLRNLEQSRQRSREWCRRTYQQRREYVREWNAKNADRLKAYFRERYEANRDANLAATRQWVKANPEKRREIARRYNRKARLTPETKLNDRMRARMTAALKSRGGYKARTPWEAVAGYTVAELKAHIERQFAPGMTWENMGEWHIDHIVPLAAFEFRAVDDPGFKAAWAITNLRPSWAIDNMKKGAKRVHLL